MLKNVKNLQHFSKQLAKKKDRKVLNAYTCIKGNIFRGIPEKDMKAIFERPPTISKNVILTLCVNTSYKLKNERVLSFFNSLVTST
jgi:hypothetical protein